MDLAKLSVKRPIFISCIVTLILLVGYISMRGLAVDLYPDVTFPTVVVNVTYDGAGPKEMETLVTKILEEQISEISGIEKLHSVSQEGMSQVIAEFTLETDIKYAEQQVRDHVQTARSRLPDDIDEPVIRTVDPSDRPVAMISLTSKSLSEGGLYDVADQMVKPKLEQVNHVGMVYILGGRKREIQVQLNADKLHYYKIAASQVSQKFTDSGENVPAGKTTGAKTETSYRSVGEFNSLDQIRDTVVRFTGDEHPLVTSQLGRVVDTLEDETSRTFINGHPALMLYVYRQSGANTIAVVDRVAESLKKLNGLLVNRKVDAKLEMVNDGSQRIRDNVNDVKESILIGIFLTVVVVYLFLGSFRSTIITGLALPNSLLGAFILMAIAGFTINVMSLLALSLAVGLLIDDAIVVRENIFRHMEMGKTAEQAALDGTKEVSLAVVATTMAILAVFGPIAFLQGVIGQFFKQFGLTICFAMLISLFDALTIAPMLSAYFAGSHHPADPRTLLGRWNRKMLDGFDRFQTALEDLYEKTLHFTLWRPKTILALTFVIFIASMYSVKFIPKTFLPALDNGKFNVSMDLPPGTSLQRMYVVANEVDQKIRAHKEVFRTILSVGDQNGEANNAEISVELYPEGPHRSMNTDAFEAKVREILKPYDYANAKLGSSDGQKMFNMNILGSNLDELQKFGDKVKARLSKNPAFTDVDTSYRPGKPEVQFSMDPTVAREAGLNTKTVGNELRNLVEGTTPALFRANDNEYNIRIRLRDADRDLKNTWGKVLVPNMNNTLVPLRLVGDMKTTTGPDNIRREDRSRAVQITADINPKGPGFGAGLQDVKKMFATDLKLPPGMSYAFYGQAERFKELMHNMMMASLLGVLFIFFVLSSLYESFITPFAIMLVLPLAAIGAFLGLLVTRSTLDLYSMIGCVMLLGLATKNSILLVDYINQMMAEGVARSEAIVKACRTRLRPILMTSLALIAGMVPVAIGMNEASQQRKSLGVAVIGGTISSTLLTLVVVPAAFIYIDRLKDLVNRLFSRYVRGKAPPSVALPSPQLGHDKEFVEDQLPLNRSSETDFFDRV